MRWLSALLLAGLGALLEAASNPARLPDKAEDDSRVALTGGAFLKERGFRIRDNPWRKNFALWGAGEAENEVLVSFTRQDLKEDQHASKGLRFMAGVKGDNGCLFMFGKAAQNVNVEAIAMSPLRDLKVARPIDMQPVSPDQALLLNHVLESRSVLRRSQCVLSC
ncbi:hypothetical protein JKP88DRAFT_232401 [Tribonema minus]|uniref:Uncharacterized protein n=1 Tax=Tribonema minus TaxID=303371 RepID=A0A836CNU7_9STRA|nr:hypothetical protein JKP88DRAFT_232401 [Tribonema minus]